MQKSIRVLVPMLAFCALSTGAFAQVKSNPNNNVYNSGYWNNGVYYNNTQIPYYNNNYTPAPANYYQTWQTPTVTYPQNYNYTSNGYYYINGQLYYNGYPVNNNNNRYNQYYRWR